jgi:predicted methyltransferase
MADVAESKFICNRRKHQMAEWKLKRVVHVLTGLTGLLIAACALAEAPAERVVGPEINSYYQNARPERWMSIFESPGRELYDRRRQITDALGLRPGMDVADVGAGTGLFAMRFAPLVGPEGRVYAVDISEPFVEGIQQRAQQAGFDNLVPIVNRQRDVALPAGSVDLVFTADTYHHFEFPAAMLASIHRALRPSGLLALIDFRRIPGVSSQWILGHVRAGRDEVIGEVLEAGFELIDEPIKLQDNYFLRFRRVER